MNRFWAVGAVALMVLTACASMPPSQGREGNQSAPQGIAESVCENSTKNSDHRGVALKQVRLQNDEADLLVEFLLFDALPPKAEVLLYIMARSPNNEARYQFGTALEDGKVTAQFVYNLSSSTPQEMSPEVVLNNQMITARFPLDAFEGLGAKYEWDARVSIDGEGGDRCPAGNAAKWNVHAN